MGTIPNRPDAVRRLVKRLGDKQGLRVCYEAGPCGYVLHKQLTSLGVACDVVAPTLVPKRPGDRIKTDRRDARRLAQLYRAGELTAVWVPDEGHEALRDLVRARTAAKEDETRARHRLTKLLLRHGVCCPSGVKRWTIAYRRWLQSVTFEQLATEATFVDYLHEVDHAGERLKRLERASDEAVADSSEETRELIAALQALRGVALLTAAIIVAEVGRLSRFKRAPQLMAYAGLVPTEHSSGATHRQGRITKTGSRHLRRAMAESGWSYRCRPCVGAALKKRQEGLSEEVKAIAWRAQHRLHKRYCHLRFRKHPGTTNAAVGRELLGFWAIGQEVERNHQGRQTT